VDAQTISGTVGVVSAAIAALALLLTWYRHGQPPDEGTESRPWLRRVVIRGRLALMVAIVVGLLAAVGITSTFRVRPPATSPSALSETQYRSQLTRLCLDTDEEARRIEEANPQNSVLGPNVSLEQREVDRVKMLNPPNSLRSIHEDLVGTWERRLTLLDSVYRRLDRPDDTVESDLGAASELAVRLTELSKSLGVPECRF